MFRLIKQVFIALLSIVNNADHIKYMSLNNQQCMTQTTLINLHPIEYIDGLRYYPFAGNLDRCKGSCNTFNDLSSKLCVSNNPKKTQDLDLSVFNMIT